MIFFHNHKPKILWKSTWFLIKYDFVVYYVNESYFQNKILSKSSRENRKIFLTMRRKKHKHHKIRKVTIWLNIQYCQKRNRINLEFKVNRNKNSDNFRTIIHFWFFLSKVHARETHKRNPIKDNDKIVCSVHQPFN